MDKSIAINMNLNASSFAKGIKTATSSVENMTESMKDATSSASKMTSVMQGIGSGVAKSRKGFGYCWYSRRNCRYCIGFKVCRCIC